VDGSSGMMPEAQYSHASVVNCPNGSCDPIEFHGTILLLPSTTTLWFINVAFSMRYVLVAPTDVGSVGITVRTNVARNNKNIN
jgi:hypothetical protein